MKLSMNINGLSVYPAEMLAMHCKRWRTVRCFQNNGPDYWIVTERAWKGRVIARCASEEDAEAIARGLNGQNGKPA